MNVFLETPDPKCLHYLRSEIVSSPWHLVLLLDIFSAEHRTEIKALDNYMLCWCEVSGPVSLVS